MFCEDSICGDSISSFWYELWNGEVFFFNGDIRTIESFISNIKTEDTHDLSIHQLANFLTSIKTECNHSVSINQDELYSGIR